MKFTNWFHNQVQQQCFSFWWKHACRSIGRCNNVFTFWCKFTRFTNKYNDVFTFQHKFRRSTNRCRNVFTLWCKFTRFTNKCRHKCKPIANANLLASKLTSQGKGCGGGNIGHNIGKLRFFDNDMTIGNITTHSHSFPKNM